MSFKMIVHRSYGKEMNAFISTLPGVFDAVDSSDEVTEAFVFAAWRHVAGAQVSERTTPANIEAGRLIIAVADKAWKLNLESFAPQLLFKLNAALGKPFIDYLEFRVDPDAVERAESDGVARDTKPAPLPVELSVSARRIRDESLRETVMKAAANCLSRKR
jgi:hypothetical protein